MDLTVLSRKLGLSLAQNKLTLAVGESCTGGMIGAAITAIPGSSKYFRGGVIAYDNGVKQRVLGVPARVLKKHGAVSAQTVLAMASGVQKLLSADCAIAISGVAGPAGGTKEKPVGLVFIGIALKKQVWAFEERFKGDRKSIRVQTVKRAIKRMLERLA
jgi:PncC family amidohydrolase